MFICKFRNLLKIKQVGILYILLSFVISVLNLLHVYETLVAIGMVFVHLIFKLSMKESIQRLVGLERLLR